MISQGFEIGKTHNINFLLDRCAKFDETFKNIEVKNINDFAVLIRYPDEVIMPELPEAKEYYQLALDIKDFVLLKIKLT